uniref:Uncharacterized protein n=1 Tax=Phakopsora pachyrhizi TaxID=170000 RepID=A0A0S1MJX5_PHAPC
MLLFYLIYSLISPLNPGTCAKFALSAVTLVCPSFTAQPSLPGPAFSTLS